MSDEEPDKSQDKGEDLEKTGKQE